MGAAQFGRAGPRRAVECQPASPIGGAAAKKTDRTAGASEGEDQKKSSLRLRSRPRLLVDRAARGGMKRPRSGQAEAGAVAH